MKMNKAFCVILFSILSIMLIFSAPVGLLPSINAALLTIEDDYGLTGTNPSVIAISSTTHSQNNNNPFLSSETMALISSIHIHVVIYQFTLTHYLLLLLVLLPHQHQTLVAKSIPQSQEERCLL
jgi:hypothetical protein